MTGGGTFAEKHSAFVNDFELPRFTRSLRAFTRLEGPKNLAANAVRIDELLRRAREQKRKAHGYELVLTLLSNCDCIHNCNHLFLLRELTWEDIKRVFKQNPQALRIMDELYLHTKEIIKRSTKRNCRSYVILLISIVPY